MTCLISRKAEKKQELIPLCRSYNLSETQVQTSADGAG